MLNNSQEWFKSWFDTEYYHILYKNRDQAEAQNFIDRLIKYLNVKSEIKLLDLACGKGRHSIHLASKGFNVLGIDLSENSIQFAKQYETSNLKFEVKDMRENLGFESFDYIFNLFTSFGYFEKPSDNLLVLNSIHKALKPNGIAVIDYFNADLAISTLPHSEQKEIDGIQFSISKFLENHKIIKKIIVNDFGHQEEYFEKVSAFTHSNFVEMFKQTGFQIIEKFQNYTLNNQTEENSRAIYIIRKI